MSSPVPPAGPPVTTIAEVIARMEAIDAALPATDGLACFNRVYLDVTRQVDADVGQRFFADPVFLTALDVVFANQYLDAVNALTTAPQNLPTAWAPLLEDRGNSAIEPIQFALAGMNAHINNDLPVAVVATCQQLATAPDDASHYADYQKVDQLLDAAEQSIRQSFESGLVLATDRHLQSVCNLVGNWSITAARDVAWNTSLALWAIRDVSFARNLLADSLARTVAMASRALLAAV
jgi:hypothetical protein